MEKAFNMRILSLVILLGFFGAASAHRLSLHSLKKLGMKHFKPHLHSAGLLAALRFVPKFFFVPYQDSSTKQVVVVPESKEFHSPSVRISRMLEGLDVKRLAREWPDSVTPGGPGPEWW